MIDVNLQTDLANKEERDKIRDAKDKVEDVAKTVENVIDKGNVAGIKENYVNNRFATRGANAVEDDPTLSKMLNELKAKNLSEDEAKEVIIATVKKMYEANGFTGVPDIKFEDVINGNTIGARGEETGTIYINVEKVIKDMGENGVGSLVGLIAHESSHSEKYTETTGIKGIEEGFADSKGDLANKKYDGTDKLLDTEKKDKDGLTEKDKALKELKENFSDELAYSEDLEANSFNEEVEGKSLGYDDDNVKNGNSAKDYKISYLPTAKEYLNALLDDTLIVEGKGPLKIPVQAINNLMNVIGVSGKPLTAFINNEILIKFASSKDKNGNVVFDEAKFKASLENVETFGLVMAQIGPQLQGLKISNKGKGTTNVVEEQKLLEYNNQNQKLLTYNGKIPNGTLSDYDARVWYLKNESEIPKLINKNLSLEDQAKQAFNLRNQYRTNARDLMKNRELAESLNKTDPNKTWAEIIEKTSKKGFKGDEIYKEIINSSQRSRTSVNESLGIK